MSTKELLIALVNAANNPSVPLDASVVALSDPIPNGGVHNTTITLSAVDDSGYTGHVDVHYNRLDISAMEPADGIRSEAVFSAQDVLAQLSPQNGVSLTEEDVDVVIPSMQVGDIVVIDVVAKAQSLGWNGTAKVALLHGLPPTSDELYELMNHLLPTQ